MDIADLTAFSRKPSPSRARPTVVTQRHSEPVSHSGEPSPISGDNPVHNRFAVIESQRHSAAYVEVMDY